MNVPRVDPKIKPDIVANDEACAFVPVEVILTFPNN
jgi:hypothetical protein